MNIANHSAIESGKCAYLMDNPDHVIFESGRVYTFAQGHRGASREMYHVENRAPFSFAKLSAREKQEQYGFLGFAEIYLCATSRTLQWEY